LKVARGDQAERKAAALAIRENEKKGCVLDLLAFWTAWRLQSLDIVVATCGPIHLTQNVMDSLRARRERINDSAKDDGLRTLHYEDGNLAFQEVPADTVAQWRDDTDRAIAWAQANAEICPLVAGEDLPAALREHLSSGRSDVIDSIVLARQLGLLLVTDDLSTRDLNRLTNGGSAAWLHQVFGVAVDQKQIDVDTYVRWSANLIDFGHDYIGASGPALAFALRADAKVGNAPGYLFRTFVKVIGGRNAEPRSHVDACRACRRNDRLQQRDISFEAALAVRRGVRTRIVTANSSVRTPENES
jgi:cellulose synthase operon protein C